MAVGGGRLSFRDPGEVHLWVCTLGSSTAGSSSPAVQRWRYEAASPGGFTLDASPVVADPALPGEFDRWLHMLDDEERARADRFVFPADRIRFVQRRAFARHVLALYLGMNSGELRFRQSTHGKPELDPPCGISFNTSRSGDLTVVAVTEGRQVGVDIERLRPVPGTVDLAEGLFAPQEIDLVRATPEGARSQAFLGLWTRKEAVVKALGGGLSIPLDRFLVLEEGSVPLDPLGEQRPAAGFAAVHLVQFDPLPGYVGAVALSDA